MSTFSDRELTDFLDGKLPEARSEALIAALTSDPALETRLMAMDDIAPVVRDTFSNICDPERLQKALPVAVAAPQTPWRPVLLAACLAGAVAVLGTLGLTRQGADSWMQQVAVYQSLYSRDTIQDIQFSDDALDAQLAMAEQALDIVLPRTELMQLDGLKLRRTQMLSYQGQPLAQIVFSDAAGLPIALCILLTKDTPENGTVALGKYENLQSAAFSQKGFGFLLLGPTNSETLSGYADDIRGVLARG